MATSARGVSSPDNLDLLTSVALGGRKGHVPLTLAQEGALALKLRAGDREAGWALVMANQNFVRSLAAQYLSGGIEMEDLVAEGLLGLMDAAERFDPERGIKFISYGSWWIKRSFLGYLNRFGQPVHVPKYKQQELLVVKRARTRLSQELGRGPSVSELAEATGIARGDLDACLGLMSRPERMASGPSGGGHDVEDPRGDVLAQVVHGQQVEALGSAMSALSERERIVVKRRHGIGQADPETLAGVGASLGVTKERVRQIERRACDKLRSALDGAKRPVRRGRRRPDAAAFARCA